MKKALLFASSFTIVLGVAAAVYLATADVHKPLRDATTKEARSAALQNALAFEKAHLPAVFGSAGAQMRLGMMYAQGLLGEPDFSKAVTWYERAAGQGEVTAQLALGYAYENGEGINQNYREALHWYKAAHDAGNMHGTVNLALVYMKGFGQNPGENPDYNTALGLFRQAAEKGETQAIMNLARASFLGLGVEKNDAEGAVWVQKAAEGGSSRARALMGILHLGGIGVEQDFDKAKEWLAQSKDASSVDLLTRLSMMENAINILPPESKREMWQKTYSDAESDIRKTFDSILEQEMAPTRAE